MLFPMPAVPVFPPGQSTTARGSLRYEDCAQDGRMIPIAVPPALGPLWVSVMGKHEALRQAMQRGVIPILTRLTIQAHEQPVRVDRPTEIRGGFVLAHDRDGDEVSRLYMNAWAEVWGGAGRIGPGGGDGPLAHAATLFAEHTLTRLFAPPDQRRVTRLDIDGIPPIPDTRYAAPLVTTAGDAPDGARWIDELSPDSVLTPFTLDQTDGNQHVNSLVYIRVFLDAVQRRLAERGQPLVRASRAIDIAYRKPCFAGDQVRSHLRLFESAGGLGAAGHITGTDGKPRCYVRVLFGA